MTGTLGLHALPAPASVLGWEPCADHRVATYEQISDYLRVLAAASDRIALFDIGTTTEGRTQLLAAVSAPENLDRLERFKDISRRLSRARGLDEEAARALAAEGRAIACVTFGLHAPEVASHQTAPQLVHDLVSGETAEYQRIREHVIAVVIPNLNPDGTTRWAEWYMGQLGTPYQEAPLPDMYQRYAAHDNNRDWYMFSLRETRNVARQLYGEWCPQLVVDVHQQGPFPARITLPPTKEPTNPHLPPLVVRGMNLVGAAMSRRLEQEGMTGAVSRQRFDNWNHGLMAYAVGFRNMIGVMTETNHKFPARAFHDPESLPAAFADGTPAREPSALYPSPWRGGEWRLRDSGAYMRTSTMAMLALAANEREALLRDSHRMGAQAIAAGGRRAFMIASGQHDPLTAVKLVNVLRRGGLEVEHVEAGDAAVPAGSYVIPEGQAYRAAVRDLLTPQRYPAPARLADGSPERPYSFTGWTLPLQMGVDVRSVTVAEGVATRPVERAEPPPAAWPAAGATGVVDPRVNDGAVLVNHLLGAGVEVARAGAAVETDAGWLPAGAFLFAADASVSAVVRSTGLRVAAASGDPKPIWRLRRPRIGVYRPWGYEHPDAGWTALVLEQFGFEHVTLRDARVRAGDLHEELDAVVLPDAPVEHLRGGLPPGSVPDEYAGGLGDAGLAALGRFARGGGTLVALNRAARLAAALLDVPVDDAAAEAPAERFSAPGSLLRMQVDTADPLGYGMPETATAFFEDGPVLRPRDGSVRVAARYAGPDPLQSGLLIGAELVAEAAALVEAPAGAGRVVLFGFRPQHRAQSHGTYKLLFNALYMSAARRAS